MYLYEELIRRFSELSHETAGEHFTPREVIRLMVNLLFIEDEDALTKPGIVRTVFDPACGTGGMLSVAEDHLRELNPAGRLEVFGQELNAETYAICRSDMMLKGQDASHIKLGNSFSEDGHEDERFDYLLANPPFGVEWKKVEDAVRTESETKGFAGRFGAGLPRINDGSFLFLQHMISKMKPASQGRLSRCHRVQRITAVHGGCRVGGVGDPPLDHRERLARSRNRPARPAVLQHGHLDLLLDCYEPEVARAARQGAVG
jgi:type I restriction enzyme M protein